MRITKDLLSPEYRYDATRVPSGLTAAQRDARERFLKEVHKDSSYTVLEACPFCGHEASTQISEVDAKGLPCDVAICDNCQGCFKLKVFTPAAAAFHYEKISYLLRGKDRSETAVEKLFQERVKSFAYPRYYFIRHFTKLKQGSDVVAEFGCGDGANLYPWKKNGFDVIGIEFDPAIADFGRRKGLEIISGDFVMHDFNNKRPKLVILSHLLEHVSDLGAVLRRIHSVIGPQGYLFIEVPGIRVQGMGKPLSSFDVEHNYYFDLKALSSALEKSSFDIEHGDEFIRVICKPVEVVPPDRRKKAGRARLIDVMKEAEASSLSMKILNRWNNAYYRFYYSFFRGRAK